MKAYGRVKVQLGTRILNLVNRWRRACFKPHTLHYFITSYVYLKHEFMSLNNIMLPAEFHPIKCSCTNVESCPAVRSSGRVAYTVPSTNTSHFREIKSQSSSIVQGSINKNNNNKVHPRTCHEGTGSTGKAVLFLYPRR
jgi:hypothetical protein